MKLVQKYFKQQVIVPLVISLGALSVLALLTQSLSTIDLIIDNRQSALTFLYITVLALPQLFSIIMPLAVFIAMLYAFNHLNMDSELIVAKASGVSPWQIASPALRVATIALIVNLLINLYVQPFSFREMRKALLDVRTDVASRMVRAGEFNQPSPGLTIYASEILSSGLMKDVLIYDERSSDTPLTYTALTGQVQSTAERTSFTLFDGNVQFIKEGGFMDITDFSSNTYDLTEILSIDPVLHFKTSDLYLWELFAANPNDYAWQRYANEYLAEGHARLSSPLYNPALVFIALVFLIRGEHQRLGYGGRIATAAALGFAVRLAGFAIASAAEDDPSLNIVQYALPITVCILGAIYLSHRKRVRSLKSIFSRQRLAHVND